MNVMKATDENEKGSKTGGDQRNSNGGNENFPLAITSDSFAIETTVETQPNEIFSLYIYKEYKLKIHKPLFLAKCALFFWFAGGHGIMSFFSVFLKERGLSVAHLSLTNAASVVFQLLGSSLSGVISDKIGRAKPVLFAHMATTVIVSIAFLLMPPLTSDATMPQFQLRSRNYDNISRLIAEAWCNTSTISNQRKTCKLFYSKNITHNSNDFEGEHCFLPDNIEKNLLSPTTFNADGTNILENIKICHVESGAEISFGTSYAFCNFSNCKLLENECISETKMCSNRQNNRILLFSVYALLITIYFMSVSCVFRFYDATVISLTEEHNAEFGRQRVFSILGTLIGPSLIGYVLQVTSGNDKNYSLAFVFFSLFTLLSALASWNVNVRLKEPGQRMWRKVLALLKNLDIMAFILILLVLGTSFNFMTYYSNWYLEDLGASKILLGMFKPLSSVFAVFSISTSKWCVLKFGTHNLFIMALVGYAFFGISFSFLIEPWFSVLIGIVAYTFSYHLLWVAVVEYAHSIAPEGLHASVIVMAGTLHYTVGKVPASLIGGMIMNAYGGRIAFRVIGSIGLVTAFLYGTFRYFRRSYLK